MSTPNPTQPQLELRKIFVKDMSFETPNSPKVFLENWNPETKIQLHTDSQDLGNDLYEVVLAVTVTATLGDKTAFLAEVKQAGIVFAKGFNQEQMGQILGIYCPTQLYPFVRETIAEVISKGGFPQMLLAPINFEGLYAMRMQQAREQAAGQAAAPSH